MMRLSILLAASAALVGGAANAAEKPSSDLAIAAIHNFAGCVVDRSARGPTALLDMDFRTDAYREAADRLARGHRYCAPGARLEFSGVLFAGALAEHLLERRAAPPLSARVAFDPAMPPIEARDETELMSLCVVRAAPDATATLFETEPASEAEKVAVKAIGPTVVGCVRAGQEMRLNRPALRALLALAAYRLARQNQLVAGS